jgi:hypothetical protein
MIQLKNIGYFFLLCVLVGCSNAVISNSWISDKKSGKKFNKILVFSIVKNNDQEIRSRMEKHFCEDLMSNRINATSAAEEFGPKSFAGLSENELLNQLKTSGYDAVFTIVLLNKEVEKYYVPGKINYTPYRVYHRRFWGYYTTIYDRVYEPGYYAVDTKYFWETNLFDLETKELIYSVQTKSFNPANAELLAHDYGKIITKDMLAKKILVE